MARMNVTIDSGPITADLHLDQVSTKDWHALMLARSTFLHTRLPYDCRRLLEFVHDAEKMFAPLGFRDVDDLIKRGFKLDPEQVAWAIEGLKRMQPNEPIPYQRATDAAPRHDGGSKVSTDDNFPAYRPTPELPDEDGKTLLRELNNLYGQIDFDENGKKRRRGSRDGQWAVTALRKAILDAADRFSAREKFRTWLVQNHCEHIEAHDPLRSTDKVVNELHNLRRRLESLEERLRDIDKLLVSIVLRLPVEVAK